MRRAPLALPLLVLLAGRAAAAAPFKPFDGLRWDLTGEDIARDCSLAQRRADMRLAQIVALPPDTQTFDNTAGALDDIVWTLSDETAADVFLKDVSVSSGTRQSAHECATAIEQFDVAVYARGDLYRALQIYAATKPALSPEARRLLDKELLDFKRNGVELPEEKRYAVRRIKQRLADLQDQFERNIAEDKSSLLVSNDELAGLPADDVAKLPREGGKYRVSVDDPDYFPFMENARNPDARRRLELLFDNRGASENVSLLREILSLRAEAAGLLGYKNHADYVLEPRMAKNAQTVDRFLSRLTRKLKPLGRRELAPLVALKDEEEGGQSDHVIHAWDFRYYDNELRETRTGVDEEKVKEYFPVRTVTAGLLDVYQTLLGVRFRRIDDASVWAPDVSLYEISDSRSHDALGYFYMDLFAREGKYKRAAAFDLVHGRALTDGTYQKPVSAIVCNFAKPSPGKPSLLKHEEVEAFFREFGRVMHQTLTTARYGRFSGTNVARDFAEAPSRLLENWVWDPQVLAKLSGRYNDHSQKLPPELLKRMIAAKNIDVGLKNLQQLALARVDLDYHTKDGLDTTADWAKVARQVGLLPLADGAHPQASFGDLVDGDDAGYYGYLWSKVYAQDMFSKFQVEGLLNPVIGRRYREEILAPGSSRDELDSLRAFLEREPNDHAFLQSLGLLPADAE